MMGGGGGNAGAQKRPLDGAGGNMDQKRARMEGPVVPPEMESLPQEGSSMDLEALKRRFEALQQEVSALVCAFVCAVLCGMGPVEFCGCCSGVPG
jgi:hypothetical protein